MVKQKDLQFFMENLKMNRKRTIFFYLLERGFELQIFSYFLAHDLNFHGREGDEIKSKQASKRFRTLTHITNFLRLDLRFFNLDNSHDSLT
jgi:hypothetical protein